MRLFQIKLHGNYNLYQEDVFSKVHFLDFGSLLSHYLRDHGNLTNFLIVKKC